MDILKQLVSSRTLQGRIGLVGCGGISQGIEIDASAHVHSGPKIDDLHIPAGGYQDVVRLHLRGHWLLSDPRMVCREARERSAENKVYVHASRRRPENGTSGTE